MSFNDPFKFVLSYILAVVSIYLLFSGIVPYFWWSLALVIALLAAYAVIVDFEHFKDFITHPNLSFWNIAFIGLLSAAVLYGVFYLSNYFSPLIFSSARAEIDSIYSLKDGDHGWYVLIFLVIIGAGEEIFWRGYVQNRLVTNYGYKGIIFSAALYTLAHVSSLNLMLILAALVCGLFWGVLFNKYRSIWLNIISHVMWDIAVFVLWPFKAQGL